MIERRRSHLRIPSTDVALPGLCTNGCMEAWLIERGSERLCRACFSASSVAPSPVTPAVSDGASQAAA